uniref:Uncharacterized protein n=1 Tax=Candidatus Kentrum sp. TUN TaxID=2126343 RepID=A0A450ZW28_9GAMM|nr:MAG: hypothetical protein BECKTUN1418F_GA0071002_11311 [Candidatus Kentron sp. TUN]VFK67023.1 MAG: hypothetical protein BECKTUN1418E_GA0071001_11281 [Candidatus Kentron sp. TUN]
MEGHPGDRLSGEIRGFEIGDLAGGIAVGSLEIEIVFPLIGAGWSRVAGWGAACSTGPIENGSVLHRSPATERGLEGGGVFWWPRRRGEQ